MQSWTNLAPRFECSTLHLAPAPLRPSLSKHEQLPFSVVGAAAATTIGDEQESKLKAKKLQSDKQRESELQLLKEA